MCIHRCTFACALCAFACLCMHVLVHAYLHTLACNACLSTHECVCILCVEHAMLVWPHRHVHVQLHTVHARVPAHTFLQNKSRSGLWNLSLLCLAAFRSSSPTVAKLALSRLSLDLLVPLYVRLGLDCSPSDRESWTHMFPLRSWPSLQAFAVSSGGSVPILLWRDCTQEDAGQLWVRAQPAISYPHP